MAFKIPVYRAQIRATTDAPGRSFNVRMSPRQMAEAELAKSAPGAELIAQAAAFTETMYKFEVETKRNEAILGAKEELMRIQDELSKTDDIFNVFKEDGSGLWQTQSEEIKQRLRDTIGRDRYALADFDNSFDQAELSMRYSLKSVIDDKIIKRREAALAARDAQVVAKFSNPFGNFSKEDVAFEVGTLNQMWTRAKANGGVNPDYVGSVNLNNMVKIAENVAMGYAGRDPNLVYALGQNLDILDQLANGQITEDQARLMAAQLPNGEWALTTLSSIPRDQANEILAGVFTEANKFQKFRDEQDKRNEDTRVRLTKGLKVDIFSNDFDSGTEYTLDELSEAYSTVPGVSAVIESLEGQGQTSVDGNQFRELIYDVIKDQLTLTEAQNLEDLIEKEKIQLSEELFPRFSNQAIVDSLTKSSLKNSLTVDDVNKARNNLSREDFEKFTKEAKAIAAAKENELTVALNETIPIVKGLLFAVDRDVLNPEDVIANQKATKVITALRVGIQDGTITNEEQLIETYKRLVAAEKESYVNTLKPIAQNQIIEINNNTFFANTVSLSSTDPLGDLEAKRNELVAAQPNQAGQIDAIYYQFYAIISKFVDRGVFGGN